MREAASPHEPSVERKFAESNPPPPSSFNGELDELMIFGRAVTQKKIQALIGFLTGEKG